MEQISRSHLILPLLSAELLSSHADLLEFCVQRATAGDCHLIPVRLRAAQWEVTAVRELQYLPRSGMPIATWKNRAQAWKELGDEIKELATVAETLQRRPLSADLLHLHEEGKEIFLSSSSLRFTKRLAMQFDLPVAIVLEDLIRALDLPTQIEDPKGFAGMQYRYSLSHRGQLLDPDCTLEEQAVSPRAMLTLQLELSAFARATPMMGTLTTATFRSSEEISEEELAALQDQALRELRQRLESWTPHG